MTTLEELVHYTQQLMQVERFNDYCPNGLQVEGRSDVRKIVTGVTASMALLQAAHQANADAILVHHGYFWRNEDARIVGMKRKRIALMLECGMSLLAYHLPLDAHGELGNNVQFGQMLGLAPVNYDGKSNLVAYGELERPVRLADFSMLISKALQREPMVIGDPERMVKKVAWCTGAAQNYIESAVLQGADVYISGEISEQTVHQATELGIAYIAAGHHATERYGIKALGEHLVVQFNLQHEFIDLHNPV